MTQLSNLIKDNYNIMLLNDYLREEIKEAGFSRVEISKTPVGTKITLYVTRPGIVIGRKGGNIKALTEKLESDGTDLSITVGAGGGPSASHAVAGTSGSD